MRPCLSAICTLERVGAIKLTEEPSLSTPPDLHQRPAKGRNFTFYSSERQHRTIPSHFPPAITVFLSSRHTIGWRWPVCGWGSRLPPAVHLMWGKIPQLIEEQQIMWWPLKSSLSVSSWRQILVLTMIIGCKDLSTPAGHIRKYSPALQSKDLSHVDGTRPLPSHINFTIITLPAKIIFM